MEGCPRSSMLSIDLKDSIPTEFTDSLKKYITDHYQEDPENYKHECQQLEQLRSACLHPGHDHSGCSILRRYFAQLQYLQSRFPMVDGGAVSIQFTWTDLYSEESIALADVRFEQAAILHNLGSLHSQLGAQEDRTGEEGMKVACTHFQAAAGVFQYLKNTVMVPLASMKLPWMSEDHFAVPFFDLASCVLQLYINILLGQAQECLLEKSILDGRKDSLIARISMQVYDYYQQALGILESLGSSYLGSKKSKMWTKAMKIKACHFTCVSYIHMSNHAHEFQKFGEKVAYLKAADQKLKEAEKQSKGQPERTLELLQFMNDVVSNKLEGAVKDNDFIFHEVVPDLAALPVIKGASLVKPIPFQPCDPSVAGPDIFQRLIPMEAHTDASIYSEEKAKLLRRYNASIEVKNKQLVQSLASLHIDDLLQPVETDTLPALLKEKHDSLSKDAVLLSQTETNIKESSKLSNDLESILQIISSMLEEDEKKEQLLAKDAQPKTTLEKEKIRKEYDTCKEALVKANHTNNELVRVYNAHRQNLELIAGSEEQLLSALPSLNIIDSPVDDGAVQRLRDLIAKVKEMKLQRKSLEENLRNKLNEDDITGLLVTQDGNKMAFFDEQLKKHDTACSLIQANLDAQDKILSALTEANAKYAKTRQAVKENAQRREEVVQALILSYNTFCELQGKLSRGVDFYKQLTTTVKKLEEKCKTFFDNHSKVLDKLIEKKKSASEPTKPPSRPSAAKPDHLLRPQQPTMPPTNAMFIPGQPSGLVGPSSIPQAPHPQQQVPRQSISASFPRHVPPPSSQPYSIPQSHIPADQAIHTPPRMSYPFPDSHRHMQVSESGQYPNHGVSSAMPTSQGPPRLQYQNPVLPNPHTSTSNSQIRPDRPHNVASYQQPDILGGQRQLPGQSNVRPQVTSQSVRPPQPDLISQVRPQFPGQFQPTQQTRPFHIPESPQSPMNQLSPRSPLPTTLSVPLEPLSPSSMSQPGQPTSSQAQNFQPRSMAPSSVHQQMNPGQPLQLQIRPQLQPHQPGQPPSFQPRQHTNQPFRPGQPFQPDQIHHQPFHQGLQPQIRPHNSSRPPFRPALPSPEHFRPQLSQQQFHPQQAQQQLPPQNSQPHLPPQSPQSPVRPHIVQHPFRPQQPPQQFGLQRPPQQHMNQPQRPPQQQLNQQPENQLRPQQPSQQLFRSQSPQPPLRPQQQQHPHQKQQHQQPQNQPFPPNQPPYQQFRLQQPLLPQKPSQQQFGSQQTSQLQQPMQFKPQQLPQGPLKPSQEPYQPQHLPNSLQQPTLTSRPDEQLRQPLCPEQLSNKQELPDGLHPPSFRLEQKSQQPLHPQPTAQQLFRPQLSSQQLSMLDQSSQLQYQPEKNHPQSLQPNKQNTQNNSSQKTFRPDLSSQQPFQADQASQQPFGHEKISPQVMEPEQSPQRQFPPNQQQPLSRQQASLHNKIQPQLLPQSHFEMSVPNVAQQPVLHQRSDQGTFQVDQQPFRQPDIHSTTIQTSRPPMEPASPQDQVDGGSQHQSVSQSNASQSLLQPKRAAHSYPETGAFLANQTSLPSSYGSWPTSSLLNQGCRPFPSSVTSSDYLTSFSVALAQSQLSQYQNSSSQQQMQQFQQQLLLQQQQLILQQQEMLKQQQSQHHAHDSDQMQIGLLLQQILQQQKQLTDLEMKIKDKKDQSKHEDLESAASRSSKDETKEISHEHQKGDKKESSLPPVEKADDTTIDNQPSPVPSDLSENHKIVEVSKADNKIPVNTFVPDYAAAGKWFADISIDKLDTNIKDSETKDHVSENKSSIEEHIGNTIEQKKEDKNGIIPKEENDISQKIENNNLKPDLFDPEPVKANQESEVRDETADNKTDNVFDLEEEGELPTANNDACEANGSEDSSRQNIEEQIKQIKDLQSKPSVFITGSFYEPGQVPTSPPKEPPPCSQAETEDNKPSLLRQCGHYYGSQISKIDQATNNSCINSDEELQALVSAVKGFDLVVKSLSNDKRGCGYDGFTIEWRELERLQEYDSASIAAQAGTMNQPKNRYKDILPWDHTRVQLASKEESDYINASFVKDITPLSPTFIATQGPIAQTLTDFWLMVWEQQANIIVMLTREVEGNKLMCHQYWPIDEGHGVLYGPIRVSLKKVVISPLSVKRVMHVQHSDSHDTLVITHLQFCGWPDKGVPESPVDLLSFVDDARLCYQQSLNELEERPIIVHCSAGVGRSGTFIILYASIQEFNANREFVNIPRLVRNLRLQRKYMVQKKEQYEFCYKTLLFYARQFLDLELSRLTPQRRASLNLGQLEPIRVAEDDIHEANNKQLEVPSDNRFIGELESDNSLDGDEKEHLESEQTIAEKYCKGTLETDAEEKNKTKKTTVNDESLDAKETEIKHHSDQHPGKVSIGVDKEVRYVKDAENDSETEELQLLEKNCKGEKSSDNADEQDAFEQKCHEEEASENADGKKDRSDLKNSNASSVINVEEKMTTNGTEENHETQESCNGSVMESKELASCDKTTESPPTKNEESCNE